MGSCEAYSGRIVEVGTDVAGDGGADEGGTEGGDTGALSKDDSAHRAIDE